MINKVVLVGRLGRDPELRETSQDPVCKFSLATSRKNKNGEEHTQWHRIVAWGKAAQNCHKYLTKGSTVYVEGELRYSKWKTEAGEDRTSAEVHAFAVQFLDKKTQAPQSKSNEAYPDGDDVPF